MFIEADAFPNENGKIGYEIYVETSILEELHRNKVGKFANEWIYGIHTLSWGEKTVIDCVEYRVSGGYIDEVYIPRQADSIEEISKIYKDLWGEIKQGWKKPTKKIIIDSF